ncbi:MAG: hypothetical protein LKE55_08465 [Prevotella sp.]|nr:hypothetical protein [Prevotella sp.]
MKNTNQGHSYSFSAKFEKNFAFGLDLMASYTFGHSYSVNDGTSSVANSNWGYYYCTILTVRRLLIQCLTCHIRYWLEATYNTPRYGNGHFQSHFTLT